MHQIESDAELLKLPESSSSVSLMIEETDKGGPVDNPVARQAPLGQC